LSVLVNAAALLIAGTLLFPLLGQIPRVALSAVIMVIAVQHLDVWSLRLVRGLWRGRSAYRFNVALDLAVVLVVAALSIAINIVPAVFIGVAIAVVLFVFRMSRSIVRRSHAYPLTAQQGIAKGNGLGPVLIVPAGNGLCALTSAAIQMSGSLAYTQF
jgi:sulfate permease, SulP family